MINTRKVVVFTVLIIGLLLTFFVWAKTTQASCTPLYGGGETCTNRGEILVDKFVALPDSNSYVDNIIEGDTVNYYRPGQTVKYKLTVKNTGGDTIGEITVKDLMPDYVEFLSGPGSFNASEGQFGTLTFAINNLGSGESRDYYIYGRIKDIPKTPICKITNRAQARASEDRFNEDTAQYCIKTTVLGETTTTISTIKEVPKTGLEGLLPAGVVLLIVLGFGIYLRKESVKLLK
jgi:uncharacterized repeat protein (TIGR01451 family)